jgi:hypothetical protein
MATFDEQRLQQLLSSFNNRDTNTGITGASNAMPMINGVPMINTGAINKNLQNNDLVSQIIAENKDYTDPRYTYDGLYQENYGDYDERMDPTMNPYGNLYGNKRQSSVSSAFPFDQFGIENFDPRVGLPSQVPQINNQNKPLNFDTSYGVANEPDEEQEFLPDQKSSLKDSLSSMGRKFGISSLLGMISGNPILGLIGRGAKGIGKGLGALNDRMQNSDFGRSRTLADYFDARSYGGIAARNRASQQNMREARAIQKQSDMRSSAVPTNQDRGRGQSFNAPTRSASATRSRDLGSMRGGVGR